MAPTTIRGRPSPKGQVSTSSLKKTALSTPGRDAKPQKTTLRSRYAVDLNLNAHSRTDPTSALSNLMKLVTSLATRIGGCQYKMTSSEHTLSLHLLSILEPFVYQSARSMSSAGNPFSSDWTTISGLSFQPTEVLDAVISHVDSKRDLLHLGLCSKRLHDVIFPRHFDYRVVRCKLSSLSVWNHLTIHRSLARNVRRLEILDERSKVGPPRFMTDLGTSTSKSIVPRGMGKRDTDFDSTDDQLRERGIHGKQEKYFLGALQGMTELVEFKWSCNHSPISLERVWGTLMATCPTSLEKIDAGSNLIFSPNVDAHTGQPTGDDSTDDDDAQDEAPALSQLKVAKFSATKHSYGASKTPDLSQIVRILQQSPNVEHLSIDYLRPSGSQNGSPASSVKLEPLLASIDNGMVWNQLSTLHLSGMRNLTAAEFILLFSRHSTIEQLFLPDMQIWGRVDLPPNSLPRLREVEARQGVLNAILDSSCFSEGGQFLRPLEIVKGFSLSGTHLNSPPANLRLDQILMTHLARHSSTIKRVELAGWHDMDDVKSLAKSIPGVNYLDLGKRLGVGTRDTGRFSAPSAPVTNIEEWLDVLEGLTELKALHGIKFFYEVSALNAPSGPTLIAGTTSLASAGSSTASSTLAGDSGLKPFGNSNDHMSLMDRSRTKKNDWMASMLVWRCPKLRRVDHWDPTESKIIVLTRTKVSPSNPFGSSAGKEVERSGFADGDNGGANSRETVTVKWDVRRVRRDVMSV